MLKLCHRYIKKSNNKKKADSVVCFFFVIAAKVITPGIKKTLLIF